jgi:hypothetical protein
MKVTMDDDEPSPASAGSHGEPVAWAVHYGLDPDPEVYWGHYPRHAAESGRIIAPLYSQPTLTDEEREAIRFAAVLYGQGGREADAETLRGLLERTRG